MVADALVQWVSRFSMPLLHISDQGSHFKEKVIKEFNRILQINHHVTTAYSPWANGTVEKVNHDIQKLLRSLLSEWQMESSQWPLLLPLIHSVLNHLPSPSRTNCSPLKIMTGSDASSPLSVVFDPDANEIWDCPMS
jgi:transposase InsO family protein